MAAILSAPSANKKKFNPAGDDEPLALAPGAKPMLPAPDFAGASARAADRTKLSLNPAGNAPMLPTPSFPKPAMPRPSVVPPAAPAVVPKAATPAPTPVATPPAARPPAVDPNKQAAMTTAALGKNGRIAAAHETTFDRGPKGALGVSQGGQQKTPEDVWRSWFPGKPGAPAAAAPAAKPAPPGSPAGTPPATGIVPRTIQTPRGAASIGPAAAAAAGVTPGLAKNDITGNVPSPTAATTPATAPTASPVAMPAKGKLSPVGSGGDNGDAETPDNEEEPNFMSDDYDDKTNSAAATRRNKALTDDEPQYAGNQ